MRAAPLVLLIAALGCQGERQPPLSAQHPLTLRTEIDRPTLALDRRAVPVLDACEPEQVVQRTADGWACVAAGGGASALRTEVDRLAARVAQLERGATAFVAARACVADDPDGNLAWVNDCAQHRGATPTPIVLHCAVPVTVVRDGPLTDGFPAQWSVLYVYGDDTGAPAADSTATLELWSMPAGLAAGMQPVSGTRHPIEGLADPGVRTFPAGGLRRLVEGRVTLFTRPGSVPPPAKLCGFGVGPAAL